MGHHASNINTRHLATSATLSVQESQADSTRNGSQLVGGLATLKHQLEDLKEALNMYKIGKSDKSHWMTELSRLPRRTPGEEEWTKALMLQQKVEPKEEVFNPDFDEVIHGMNKVQLAAHDMLKYYAASREA